MQYCTLLSSKIVNLSKQHDITTLATLVDMGVENKAHVM